MSSINLAVFLVSGCALGLLVLGLHPDGLDPVSGCLLLQFACAASICAFIGRHDKRTLWASLLLASALVGCGFTLLSHQPAGPGDMSFYNYTKNGGMESRYFVTGVIAAEPLHGDRSQQLRIEVENLRINRTSATLTVKGYLLAIVPPYPEYSFGERLVLEGTVTSPPILGDFDYAAWLARQGVYSYMTFPHITSMGRASEGGLSEFIASARSSARNTLRRQVAEPEAELAVGVVVGDRSSLSDEIIDAFRRTGTTHVLAISGQNITAMLGVIWLAWSGKQRRRVMPVWLLLIVLALLVFYAGFTGASPPVVRAAVMGAIVLAAPLVRRRYDPMAALSIAAAGMVLLDPDVLLDAGFQLSFLAMWGLVTFAPSLATWFQKARVPGVFAYPIAVGLSAQVATLPLLVVITGQVSVVSLFATMTADVTLTYLMMAGILTVALGALGLAPLAWICGMATWLCSAWMLWWVEWWAGLSWAAFPVEGFNSGYAVAYYTALFAGVWLFSESKRRARIAALWPDLRLALLGATAVAVWTVAILMVLAK